MPTLFYEIFNHLLKLDADIIKEFKDELNSLFQILKDKKDIDNLTVLSNKLEHLLNEEHSHLGKKEKKQLKSLEIILEDINDTIESEKQAKKSKAIDVLEKVEKKYKKCSDISADKKDEYFPICAKKQNYEYEKELVVLQLELLKLQNYIKRTGQKVLLIFEGRDAAGKGGTIKRFKEYLNPRGSRVVALEKPNEVEKTQWYFQRYVQHLPSAGEMTFFDRSWYNRAWVEPVMGFVRKGDYNQFLKDVPAFEKMLKNSGIKVIKFYFSVGKSEQAARFESRKTDPLKQFKLSPIDQFSQQLWDKYSLAEYHNFKNTHSKETPWTLIKSDNKKKARINAIKHVLNQFDYPEKIDAKLLKEDSKIVYDGKQKVQMLEEEIDITQDLFE